MTGTDENEVTIRRATGTDVAGIRQCVDAAYTCYIERIGKPPGPMLDDYDAVVANQHAFVAVVGQKVVGLLVLIAGNQTLLLDNIAVHPDQQGTGLGRRLLELAERQAGESGYSDIELYTHERMTENVAIYERWGYQETERRTVDGYDRIYMRKRLS